MAGSSFSARTTKIAARLRIPFRIIRDARLVASRAAIVAAWLMLDDNSSLGFARCPWL